MRSKITFVFGEAKSMLSELKVKETTVGLAEVSAWADSATLIAKINAAERATTDFMPEPKVFIFHSRG